MSYKNMIFEQLFYFNTCFTENNFLRYAPTGAPVFGKWGICKLDGCSSHFSDKIEELCLWNVLQQILTLSYTTAVVQECGQIPSALWIADAGRWTYKNSYQSEQFTFEFYLYIQECDQFFGRMKTIFSKN